MTTRVGLQIRALHTLAGLALGALAASGAQAGPFGDFEKTLGAAYAPYRVALMATNQQDKAATEQSLQAFETKWTGLMSTYRSSPPPQYADDPKWSETVGAVEQVIAKAKAEVAKGDLANAHMTLEAVRARLGELRARNGVITLSDRLDAYHEKMEQILAGKYGGFSPDGISSIREDAAVLLYLVSDVERFAPATIKADTSFAEGLTGLTASAKALQTAAKGGERPAIESAMQGLKAPYARLFVKFG